MRPRTFRGRIALFYAIVLAAVLLAFSVVIYLVVMADEEEDEEAVALRERMGLAVGIGLPVAIGVAVGGGAWVFRRGFRPLDDVVRVARQLDADNLAQRIPIEPGAAEEVAGLIATLNGMLARIEVSVGGLRRFTADASHELRTPVSILMAELEAALRRRRSEPELRAAMESALEDLARFARLIESLLTLARSDAGELPLDRRMLDAGELLREAADPYEAVAVERGIRFEIEAPPGLAVTADPFWLGRAVANLVDNACKFTPGGGRVRASVERENGRVRIAVDDMAARLPEAERERVFERFFRADSVRGSVEGFGLGLPLAREISRALGGDLVVAGAPEGGNRFAIELPAAPAEPASLV